MLVGKGSKQRPSSVPSQTYRDHHDRIFGTPKSESVKGGKPAPTQPKPTTPPNRGYIGGGRGKGGKSAVA